MKLSGGRRGLDITRHEASHPLQLVLTKRRRIIIGLPIVRLFKGSFFRHLIKGNWQCYGGPIRTHVCASHAPRALYSMGHEKGYVPFNQDDSSTMVFSFVCTECKGIFNAKVLILRNARSSVMIDYLTFNARYKCQCDCVCIGSLNATLVHVRHLITHNSRSRCLEPHQRKLNYSLFLVRRVHHVFDR